MAVATRRRRVAGDGTTTDGGRGRYAGGTAFHKKQRRHAYHGDAFPHPNDERATAQTHDLSPYRPLGTFIHGAEYHGKRKHRNTGNTPDRSYL